MCYAHSNLTCAHGFILDRGRACCNLFRRAAIKPPYAAMASFSDFVASARAADIRHLPVHDACDLSTLWAVNRACTDPRKAITCCLLSLFMLPLTFTKLRSLLAALNCKKAPFMPLQSSTGFVMAAMFGLVSALRAPKAAASFYE